MTHGVDELWRLLREAYAMPYGAAQIALVEQIMRHADATGDRDLAFTVRMLATTAYVYGGEEAKAFVTFSWCLSDFDRDPAPHHRRHTRSLLWYFKTMVSALTRFPDVPLTRTRAVLDDMERRYREGGHSLQAVHKHRFLVARHVGDEDGADRWYERWITTPRDDLSDCAGCDPTSQVRFLADRGRDDEAIALAEPVLAGHLSCTEQPQGILTALMLPYLRTGRLDAAADAHRRAYRLVRGNLADLWDIGEHIEFCARTGNEARGLEILQRHLDWLDRAPSPAAAMTFAAAAALLLRRLAATGHADVTVHRGADGPRPAADVPVATLADELAGYASGLAARFDARNDTPAQGRRIAAMLSAEPLGVVLPLSATARRRAAAAPGAYAARQAGGSTAQDAAAGPTTPDAAAGPTRPAAGAGAVAPGADAGAGPTASADGAGPLAGTGPVAAVAPAVAEIPADADAATLVELADGYLRTDRDAAADEVLRVFDERFADAGLAPAVAALRADLRGMRCYDAGDHAGAEAAWREAAELFTRAGDDGQASAASARLGLLYCVTDRPDQGLPLVERDVARQSAHDDARRRAGAYARLATALLVTGRGADALAALDRADAEAAGADDPHQAAAFTLHRVQILEALGRADEARQAAGAARAAYRRLGGGAGYATACAAHARLLDDPAEVLVAFDEALAAGTGEVALNARLGRARALLALDRAAEAVDDYVEVVAVCTEQGIDDGAAFTRHELATAYRRAGRPVEAAEVAEEAVTALQRLGHQEAADRCRYLLAHLYREIDDDESALAVYERLATNLDGFDNLPARAQALEEAGDVLYRRDRDALAAQRYAAAAQAYAAAGLRLDELRVRRRVAMARHWSGDPEAASAALGHADAGHAALPADEAAQPGAVWERALLDVEAARILMAAGRFDEALARVGSAPERLRGIEAFAEAVQAELLLGEVLLMMERPAQAEPVLRAVLDGLPRGSAALPTAASLLVRALEMLDRDGEAAALRAEHGLDADD
jgi:tetratricopeptide (TPR) repeat protein